MSASLGTKPAEQQHQQQPHQSQPPTPTSLPWDRFHNWVHCICTVTFDLELGQAMELMYPAHITLSDAEKTSVCYLAFPDSNSGCMGDTQYHFRIREQCLISGGGCVGGAGPRRSYRQRAQGAGRQSNTERLAPSYLHSCPGYLFGFVYFRQVKDASIRRGYFQKSVVLMSRLPYVALYRHLLQLMSPEFFLNGPAFLEAVCHDIDQWPAPVPGQVLHLPILGSVLQVRIPAANDRVPTASAAASEEVTLVTSPAPDRVLPTVHEVNLFNALAPVLPHAQLLWELVLLNAPLIVMGPDPDTCSNLVQALVNCIFPLRYATDYRPYFTIHDCEFKEFTAKSQSPPSVMLGVTNPFFAKALQHWPHIVKIGAAMPTDKELKVKRKSSSLKSLDFKPGIYSKYTPYLVPDKSVLKRINKGVQRGRQIEAQSVIIRRQFAELTHSFMIPLERYVASLMPLQKSISPFKAVPLMRSFNSDEFLRSLGSSGPQLTSMVRGDWPGLYQRFLASPNFAQWLSQRQSEAHAQLEALHAEALCGVDLLRWSQGRAEVEIVDLVLKLRERLRRGHRGQIPLSVERLDQLQFQLDAVIASMPDDLRAVMLSAPQQQQQQLK
ncbi:hypothetical protein BOX15_Mlig010237g2 [Macrostomum lignano]|uniref:Uncharacterized protein n=2 Tax=Macrostomum lignano TaxID=282301 RepID=A0A267G5Y5_9PLAT|nr:hypothetical protein BOX15_Mlig010237g2 [Macrostomum lignano]